MLMNGPFFYPTEVAKMPDVRRHDDRRLAFERRTSDILKRKASYFD